MDQRKGLGSLHKKQIGRNPDGSPKLTTNWYLAIRHSGKLRWINTGTPIEKDAQRFQMKFVGGLELGKPFVPRADVATVSELWEIRKADLVKKERRAVDRMWYAIKPIIEYFGADTLADKITAGRLDQYMVEKLKTQKAATVRLQVAECLKSMRLARKQGRLAAVPEVDLPSVNNVRSGFFEEAEYEQVLVALKDHSPDAQAAFTIGYLTSWRINEVFGLRISDIDFERKTVSIQTSKNGEGRSFPFGGLPELAEALRTQAGRAKAFQMRHGREAVGEWLFPCPHAPGRRWNRPDRIFKAAFEKIGLAGRHFHDLRRTAIRNFDRIGISRNVAMKLSGHKTESIYNRYRIVNDQDQVEAVEKLGQGRATTGGK